MAETICQEAPDIQYNDALPNQFRIAPSFLIVPRTMKNEVVQEQLEHETIGEE